MGALGTPPAAASGPHPSSHWVRVERLAQLGVAVQHSLRVVPPLAGRWLGGTVAPCPLDGRARSPGAGGQPALGIVDRQTVKVMAPAGPRGNDAAKKINGRKRHILTDSC